MQDEEFEWDNCKASQNWRNHAVTFEAARDAFRDAFAIEWPDDMQGPSERRFCLEWWSSVCCSSHTRSENTGLGLSLPERPNHTKDADIMKKIVQHDWTRFDELTDAQVHAAALSDPDAQPMTDAAMMPAVRVPRAKTLRRALGLTQEEFAARYLIPIVTLRDWELGRAEPDPPARAYLRAIAGDPIAVQRALHAGVW